MKDCEASDTARTATLPGPRGHFLQRIDGMKVDVDGCMHVTTYRDLLVWQQAMDLVVDVYQLTDLFPGTERFTLIAQTRRTAISIPSNIAEGANRRSTRAFLNHVDIAHGSEGELFTQLELGRRLGFVTAARVERSLDKLSVVGRMLNGLAASLEERLQKERSLTPEP